MDVCDSTPLHQKPSQAVSVLFYFLTYYINERNALTINPALNPGHPDQQREESPVERIF